MKRIMAVGCSHGEYIDPIAKAGVLKFRRDFKPHTVVHLGDAWDFACLRSGARGNSLDIDRGRRPEPDIEQGKEFIEALQPTHFLFGNHEHRVTGFINHWQATTAHYASLVMEELTGTLDKIGAKYTTDWSLRTHFQFGDYKFLHGTLFGQGFLKKTAMSIGNCVVAHAHHPGVTTAERDDGARAYSPGCLRTIDSAGYAKERAATLAWGHGVVWGEYDDLRCHLWLHLPTPWETRNGWRCLPV